MDLSNVFGYLRVLGGEPPPLTIVGCEPATVEPGMGLSAEVTRSVDAAVALVRRIVDEKRALRARDTNGGVPC
jgi:hydrogenase maturation protease